MKPHIRNLTPSPKFLNSLPTMKKNHYIIPLVLTAALVLCAGTARAATSVWTGSSGLTTNWSTAGNWSALPTAADDVKFYDGGNTNAAGVVNSVADGGFSGTIKSLQYANSNGFHTTLIEPGKTLIITNGLYVGTGTSNGNAFQITATVKGAGGSLLLSNNFLNVAQPAAGEGPHLATLDLSGLDNLTLRQARLYVAAGGTANLRSLSAALLLARTNVLTLTGVTPTFLIGDTGAGAGTTNVATVLLGQTNAIFSDVFVVGGRKQASSLSFNPSFSSPSLFLRKDATGARVTLLGVGDAGFTGITGSSSTTNVMDLSSGTSDILATTVYVGRTATVTSVHPGMTGTLTLGAGTLDVNTLEVGYLSSLNAQQNAIGIVNVVSGGTLVVNNSLRLGRNPGTASLLYQGYGTINVDGGTIKCLGDIVDGGVYDSSFGYLTSKLNVTNGLVDMFPAGDSSPGSITVRSLTLGSAGLITNAATITVSNILTVAAGGGIAGTNTTINLPSGATMDVTAAGFTLGSGQKLQNGGTVSGNLTLDTGATLLPGNQGVVGTLTCNNNLTLNAGGTLAFDLPGDLLQVNGSLVLNGTNTVNINPLSPLANGTYTLISVPGGGLLASDSNYFQIAGAVNGTRRDVVIDTSSGTAVNLVVSGTDPVSLTWSGGNSANTWDVKGVTNWNTGTEKFYNADSVTFDDTGSASPAVNLVGTLLPGGITVNNSSQDYTFAGSGNLSGSTGLTKQGSGKLTIAGTGSHDLSGTLDIQSGTLAFDRADAVAFAATISNGGDLVNQGAGVVTLSGAIGGTGTVVQQGAGELILTGVNGYSGDTTISSGTLSINSPGQLGGGSYPNNITNNGALIYNSSAAQTLAGNLTGTGSLIQSNGNLTLSGTNSYTGGTFIAFGNLILGTDGTLGNLPPQAGGVLTNYGALVFNRGDTITYSDQIVGTGGVQSKGSGTAIVSGANTYSGQNFIASTTGGALRITHGSALGDVSSSTKIIGGNTGVNPNGNGRLELAGDISVPETLVVECRQNAIVDVPAIVNVSGSNTLTGQISGDLGGSDWNISSDGGKLTIAGNLVHITGSTSGTRKLKLMGAAMGEWSGVINNGNAAATTTVVKTNSGAWILSGANLYTGGTLNKEGTLLITGSLVAGDPVTNAVVNSPGATLGGGGTINGTLSIQTGSIVTNRVGSPLTVGTLDMAGNATMNVATTSALGGGDYILMNYTTLTNIGQFTSVNISGAGLAPAVTNYSVVIGGGAVKLQLLPAPSVNPNPTNITVVVTNGQLVLSWPEDRIGWYLQLQTNALNIGLSDNWFTVPGSSGTNVYPLDINPANGSVFGRLVYTNAP
jgi:fibronectin-binding autotransporter adhesin